MLEIFVFMKITWIFKDVLQDYFRTLPKISKEVLTISKLCQRFLSKIPIISKIIAQDSKDVPPISIHNYGSQFYEIGVFVLQ